MPFPKGYRNTQTGKGRPPGVLNKATADIKMLAREHGPAAVQRLAELAGFIPNVPPAKLEATQIAAIHELLDRGYGRATQAHTIDGDHALMSVVMVPMKRPAGSYGISPPTQEIEGAIVDAEVVECHGAMTDGEVEATD